MTGRTARVVPFGDRGRLVRTEDVAAAHALARAVERRQGDLPPASVEEVVVGFACVLMVLGDESDAGVRVEVDAWLDRLLRDQAADAANGAGGSPSAVGVTHVLPVIFDGADLDVVAGTVGLPRQQVIDGLVAAELEAAFVGFAPGFPYLTGLPSELAALPRRDTPRTSVPAGSVAVGGGFASVYPRATPGGWHLLGRTAESLFDPVRPPYSRVSPGDRVRFVIADQEADAMPPGAEPVRELLSGDDGPCVEVLAPGALDLIQDGGRVGSARLGVPRGGAADPRALALANLLLGNDKAAATIECTVTGPTLRMVGDGHLAVVGVGSDSVDVTVDGRSVPDSAVLPVQDGQVVAVARVRRGVRAYIGVAGGFEVPRLFGSRSSDVLSGLGSGPLRVGDRLSRGRAGRVRGRLDHLQPAPDGRPVALRVLPGPHVIGHDRSVEPLFDQVVSMRWTVGPDVDRVGARLDSPVGTRPTGSAPVASTPMLTGAIQLPPDGRPILLLPDHATIGGYPVVACVITADLPLLGQLAPGDDVVLRPVDDDSARVELERSRQWMASAVSGWFPTMAGT